MVNDTNEDDIAGILDLMRENDHILSLTVQTMTYTGQRGSGFVRTQHVPVDLAANRICQRSNGELEFGDFVTRPSAHPLCYLICYMLKSRRSLVPLARFAPREKIEQLIRNSYLIRPGKGGFLPGGD